MPKVDVHAFKEENLIVRAAETKNNPQIGTYYEMKINYRYDNGKESGLNLELPLVTCSGLTQDKYKPNISKASFMFDPTTNTDHAVAVDCLEKIYSAIIRGVLAMKASCPLIKGVNDNKMLAAPELLIKNHPLWTKEKEDGTTSHGIFPNLEYWDNRDDVDEKKRGINKTLFQAMGGRDEDNKPIIVTLNDEDKRYLNGVDMGPWGGLQDCKITGRPIINFPSVFLGNAKSIRVVLKRMFVENLEKKPRYVPFSDVLDKLSESSQQAQSFLDTFTSEVIEKAKNLSLNDNSLFDDQVSEVKHPSPTSSVATSVKQVSPTQSQTYQPVHQQYQLPQQIYQPNPGTGSKLEELLNKH